MNSYTYVECDPTNRIDPSGMDSDSGGDFGGGGASTDYGSPKKPPCQVEPNAYTCSTKCAKVNEDGTGGGNCVGHVEGTGTGGTQAEACKAAKKDANDTAGLDGCRADHCKPCECKKK